MPARFNKTLIVIVIAQFFCTSLWFAGNAVLPSLTGQLLGSVSLVAHITSAVQFGFIAGTLFYAALMIADRLPATKVFLMSALLGAAANAAIVFNTESLVHILSMRFLTGFFLAGIYPVGMKIAADHFENKLGKALGYLVGALVLGTALPHLLKSFTIQVNWKMVIYATSLLSIAGGMLMFLVVKNVPQHRRNSRFVFKDIAKVFANAPFRQAAFGYFGHMWELYTFWAFVPVMLTYYAGLHEIKNLPVPILSFAVIACGSISCVAGGYLAQKMGAARIAFGALTLSGICCLISPIMFAMPPVLFIGFLLFWGLVVIADSPLFSSLVATYAAQGIKGTALTLVTCVGFSITIISIELLQYLGAFMQTRFLFLILVIGPVVGLFYKRK